MQDENGQIKQIYDKKHLVPFGEYIPFINFLDVFVETGTDNNGITGFSIGQKPNEITFDHFTTIAIFICYESIFSNELDKNITKSDLIIHLTNDAWFGASIGPKQHIQMAQMRAIENSKPVIRVTNNGITGVIDHKGNFVKTLPQFVQSELELRVTGRSGETFYNRVRSSLVLFLIVMTCIILITRKNLSRSTK